MATQDALDAKEQFLQVEWLGNKLIGTELVAFQPILGVILRGKENEGNRADALQLAGQVKPGAIRESNVDDDELKGRAGGCLACFLAAPCPLHGETLPEALLEGRAK